MSLFELEEGRLVPAQFGQPVPSGFTPQVVDAVRAQVLEIIARPLFPITWRGGASPDVAQPRLTALDASGQVVAVEVVEYLGSESLIDALSRLADTAAMSWTDLAAEYPGGPHEFRRGWVQFRESMPPSPPNGPRLILVAAKIADEVRPALDVLSSSGVEVHEMSLRRMQSGRAFLDVSVVGPRVYGHRANLLLGESVVQGLLEDQVKKATSAKPAAVEKPLSAPTDVLARRSRAGSPTDVPAPPTGGIRRRRAAARPFPSRLERRRGATRGHTTPTQGPWPRSPQALEALGQTVGRPVTLVYLAGVPVTAELSPTGVISVAAGAFTDPTEALAAEGITGLDGWSAWHIGDQYGPTLGEALAELNAQF